MISPDKIIVGIDFKKLTNAVISYSIWLSNVFSCKNLSFFHILEYNLTPPSYLIPYINKEKEKIKDKLDLLADKVKKYSLNVEIKVLFGRLIESINKIAKESNTFMVLGFISHVTRPSTSERILRGVKIPVLIVKSEDFVDITPEKINISKILCPIDFSDNSLRALEVAKEISNKIGAKLLIIHIIPENKVKAIIEDPVGLNKYLEYLKEEAKHEIEKIARGYEYEVIIGIPSEEILQKAKEADLIVIGSKGRSYTEAVIVGSVAEAVIESSKNPVMLIP
ncbi:MAG: universal stress protein [Thermodesulfovibrio sp.]|nr:universal stress protein [Thermodesulfovibrio sp.]